MEWIYFKVQKTDLLQDMFNRTRIYGWWFGSQHFLWHSNLRELQFGIGSAWLVQEILWTDPAVHQLSAVQILW